MRTTARFAFMGVAFLGILFLYPLAVGAEVDGYADKLPAWTHVGSACTVKESSLDLFAFDGASLKFKTGKTASNLIARCNVVNPLDGNSSLQSPDWNGLIVDYRDPDGKGTSYRVRVFLKSLRRTDGASSIIATFDSNSFASTARVEHLETFTHTFDFRNYEYYVEIWMLRTNTEGDPFLKAVRLARVEFIPT